MEAVGIPVGASLVSMNTLPGPAAFINRSRLINAWHMPIQGTKKHHFSESQLRSLVKTVTYRALILALNYVAVLLMTDRSDLAFNFMLVSSLYTIPGYYLHERLWDRLHWGKKHRLKPDDGAPSGEETGHIL